MSPFKYILHSLNRQGLTVKRQPTGLTHQREEPSSNEIYISISIDISIDVDICINFSTEKETVTKNNGFVCSNNLF